MYDLNYCAACLKLTQHCKSRERESCSVTSDSLQSQSLGQNTGVGSLFLLQGIFLTQGSNPGLPHCRGFLY